MRLREIVEALEAEVVLGEDQFELDLPAAGASDLMSDLLFFGRPEMILLTGLTKLSVIRAAQVADVAAIVFVRGKRPDDDTIALAKELAIPLLISSHSMYDSCGRLYARGLPGVMPAARASGQSNPA